MDRTRVLIVGVVLVGLASFSEAKPPARTGPTIKVLSNRPDLISGALTALNFGQLPASLVLLAVASKLEGRSWPFVASARPEPSVRVV